MLPARPAFYLRKESSYLGHHITEGDHLGHSPKLGAPGMAALATGGAAQLSSYLLLLSLRPKAFPLQVNLTKLQVPGDSSLFMVVETLHLHLSDLGSWSPKRMWFYITPNPSCKLLLKGAMPSPSGKGSRDI